MKLFVRIKTEEQLERALRIADVIICPADVLSKSGTSPKNKSVYIDLPDILRGNRAEGILQSLAKLLPSFPDAGLVVKNLDELGLLKAAGISDRRIIADSFLYAYNKDALRMYRDILEAEGFTDILFMASDELTDPEEAQLFESSGEQFIYKVYGRQRVMFTAQSFSEPKAFLKSDMGDELSAVWEDAGYTTIYTRRPVSMIDKLPEINSDFILADFTTETGTEMSGILASLDSALKGKSSGTGSSGSVRGHHFKGID